VPGHADLLRADMVWSRPAVTILGSDCPPVLGSTAAITPHPDAELIVMDVEESLALIHAPTRA
jgi:hypothetical protein